MVLGLEVQDFWMATHSHDAGQSHGHGVEADHQAGREADHDLLAAISTSKSNYQDFGRYAEVDLAIAADAEATLPALIEAARS